MPNRQKLRKKLKEEQRQLRRATHHATPKSVSATAQTAIAQQILRGGRQNIEEALEQLLMESASLRGEPEFRDLYFDVEQTSTVSARVFRKYEKRFKHAEKATLDERQQLYDHFRIEVIDELATPEFRQDFLARLECCADRFQREARVARWEAASLLSVVLETTGLPWGIYALVTTIYEDTRKQVAQQHEEEMELLGEFRGLVEQATDLADILPLGMDPEQAEAIARKLDAKPGLRERLQQQAKQMLEHFEDEIFEGKYDLRLFSTEEIMRALDCFNEYLRSHQVDTARAKPEQLAAPFADCIKQSLSGIATPERIEQLTDDLQKTAREWLHKGKSEGALLQIESNWLADDPSNDHPFIYTLFAGQLRSLGEAPCAKAK